MPTAPTPELVLRTPAELRASLRYVIAALADQIADGSTALVDDMWAPGVGNAIDLADLRRLARLCDERQLPVDAARIRRWLDV